MVALAALLVTLAAAAPEPGSLVDAVGAPVTIERFLDQARAARIILVGEAHSDACDHAAQRRLIEAMARAQLAPAIGFEMIPVDQAQVVRLFNQRRIRASALDRALDWGQTWGFPYPLYRPLFEAAERFDLPIVALNVPHMAAFLVGRHGADPGTLRPRASAPEPFLPASPAQREELEEHFSAHQGFGASRDFESFEKVQAMWDSKMAQEAVRAARGLGRRVVVIAGAGHVEPLGIPFRIGKMAPELPLLVVQPWRGGEPLGEGGADLGFYCPKR